MRLQRRLWVVGGCRHSLNQSPEQGLQILLGRHTAVSRSAQRGTPGLGRGVHNREVDLVFVGIEIEERYCEIAARRLAQGVLDFGGAA